MGLRKRTFALVDDGPNAGPLARKFNACVLLVICTNIVALVLETVPEYEHRGRTIFEAIELLSVVLFTFEYVMRVWSCPENLARGSRIRFMMTPLALVDLLAILPFYLPLLGLDLRFVRAIRLFRLFRIAKLARYSDALHGFHSVIAGKKEELIIAFSFTGLVVLLAACLMYFAEREAQPQAFASIPAAMWWAVVTLTTVGYGDVCPVTPLGRLLTGIVAVCGIGVFALPTAILGAAFVEHFAKRRKRSPGVRLDVSLDEETTIAVTRLAAHLNVPIEQAVKECVLRTVKDVDAHSRPVGSVQPAQSGIP